MVSAYILIQVEVGHSALVAKDVAGIKGVGLAEAVAGPYDVIARGPIPQASTCSPGSS